MIDRQSLRISVLLLFAMIVSAFWRLTLPDWPPPGAGSSGHGIVNVLSLLIMPANLVLSLLVPALFWTTMPPEARSPLPRFNGKMIVSWSVFWTVLQVFVLARSLQLVSPSGLDTARGGLAMIGVIFMLFGNLVPKTPVPPQRGRLEPNAWRLRRQYRMMGKLFVGLGLAFVSGGIILPPRYWQPVFLCLTLAALAAGIWHSIKLRRERSP